jgi:hypothetical protein
LFLFLKRHSRYHVFTVSAEFTVLPFLRVELYNIGSKSYFSCIDLSVGCNRRETDFGIAAVNAQGNGLTITRAAIEKADGKGASLVGRHSLPLFKKEPRFSRMTGHKRFAVSVYYTY